MAARAREERNRLISEPIPSLSWIDPSECDAKTVSAVRYHTGESKPVYLWGPPGAGKTAIAGSVCIEEAKRVAAAKQVAPEIVGAGMWMSAVQIISLIRRARFDKGVVLPGATQEVSEGHLWDRFGRKQLLVVDDIGVGGAGETDYEILWRLADIRQRLPTIYTSNFSPAQILERYDSRIQSRLCCGTVIELRGKDRRLAQQTSLRRDQEKP